MNKIQKTEYEKESRDTQQTVKFNEVDRFKQNLDKQF